MEKQPGLRSWPFPHVVEALRKSQSLSFPAVKWDSWITFSSTFVWFLFSGPFLKFLFKGTSSDDSVVSVKRCPGIGLRWAFKYLIAWYVFIFCCETHYPNWVAQKSMCHLPGSTGQDQNGAVRRARGGRVILKYGEKGQGGEQTQSIIT